MDPEDDVVRHKWGSDWRMPTEQEWRELQDPANCLWEWKGNYNKSGVNGYLVTSKKKGYEHQAIFLPAAGFRNEGQSEYVGISGFYWSSSFHSDKPDYAWSLIFNKSNLGTYTDVRYDGLTIRPVTD